MFGVFMLKYLLPLAIVLITTSCYNSYQPKAAMGSDLEKRQQYESEQSQEYYNLNNSGDIDAQSRKDINSAVERNR